MWPNIIGEICDIPHGNDEHVLVTGSGAFTVTMGRSAGNGYFMLQIRTASTQEVLSNQRHCLH